MAPAAKEFYEDQKNLNKLCNFLRSTDGPAVREAIMMDKRVYYIKGKLKLCVIFMGIGRTFFVNSSLICLCASPTDDMLCNRYFYVCTGEKLVNFMVEPKKGTKWPKELPRFSSRPEAITVCKELCNIQYIHRSEKVAKGELEVRIDLFGCLSI